MKYLKISIILLIGTLAINSLVASAYATSPVGGTVEVMTGTWGATPYRTKVNFDTQRLMIVAANCEGCTFAARAELTDGSHTSSTTNIAVGSTVDLPQQASYPEDWRAGITRSNFSIINRTVGYSYDPNSFVY